MRGFGDGELSGGGGVAGAETGAGVHFSDTFEQAVNGGGGADIGGDQDPSSKQNNVIMEDV